MNVESGKKRQKNQWDMKDMSKKNISLHQFYWIQSEDICVVGEGLSDMRVSSPSFRLVSGLNFFFCFSKITFKKNNNNNLKKKLGRPGSTYLANK
jgi:hypothetical protein